jgi:glycosyltransferase involved in cell wall biosynthesis
MEHIANRRGKLTCGGPGRSPVENCPVAVIILTFNEAANLSFCLESVKDLTDEIFIVDSFSTDQTLEIARNYTEKIYQHEWTHGAGQRQWALANLPFSQDWILFLDADERLTASLKEEIRQVIASQLKNPSLGGFYLKRRLIFLGRQIRWGSVRSGLKELRLVHRRHLEIRERAGWEIYVSNLKVGSLAELMVHEDKKPLAFWIARHNRYAGLEAEYLWEVGRQRREPLTSPQLSATDQRLYWREVFRERIWHRLPFGFRPCILFVFYYFFRLGFLDGKAGLIYHFLQNFWYRFLVDSMLYELETRSPGPRAH